MSILIEGMEMPTEGGTICVYKISGKFFAARAGKDELFPIIPVPEPHGLIDREQILDSIRLELAQANAVNDMDDYDSWVRVFDYVRKFPTVIPGSEEG